MSLKRFLQILRFLQLNDNSKMPKKREIGFDKLYKVKPLVEHLNRMYKEAFYPGRNLAIDESMVGFKGRSTLKQYMPLKPTKRGFKIWAIACATSGFLLGFEIYQGKSERDHEFSLGANVVLSLSSTFRTLGYCLFFDRFFTSLPLLKKLLDFGLFACGTMQINRKYFPKEKLADDKRLQLGGHDFAMAGDISVSKWKDRGKKSVIVASNMHNPIHITHVKRTNKKGEKENVECPQSISDYNQSMGGVDLFDQMISSYSISWKSRRWWMKLFYYLVDSAIVNSFILYKTTVKMSTNTTKPMTHLNFRSALANQLIADFSSRASSRKNSAIIHKATKKGGRLVKGGLKISNVGVHFPISGTCKRCAFCSTKKHVKRSRVECNTCKVSLCINCFLPFHTQ